MRRLKFFLLATSASLIGAPAAFAVTGNFTGEPYLGLSGDLTWLSHTDTGGGGNAALGWRMWPGDFGDFRVEGEVGYHGASNNTQPGNTHYYSYMGNLYYDFNVFQSHALMPYIGAGLGDATVHFGPGSHDNVFAYQLMAGLSYSPATTPNTDWYAGYRYVGSDRADGTFSERLNANNLEIGLRTHF